MALRRGLVNGLASQNPRTVRKTLLGIAEPSEWNALLEGAEWGRDGVLESGHPELQRFRRVGRRVSDILALVLLYAPPDATRVAELIASAREFSLSPKNAFSRRENRWSLEAERLDRFEGLRSLSLGGLTLTGTTTVGVTHIGLRDCIVGEPDFMANCVGLTSVSLRSMNLKGVALAETVERLVLMNLRLLADLSDLPGAAALKHLSAFRCWDLKRMDLSQHSALIDLRLERLWELDTLCLPESPSALRKLFMRDVPRVALDGITGKVEGATIERVGTNVRRAKAKKVAPSVLSDELADNLHSDDGPFVSSALRSMDKEAFKEVLEGVKWGRSDKLETDHELLSDLEDPHSLLLAVLLHAPSMGVATKLRNRLKGTLQWSPPDRQGRWPLSAKALLAWHLDHIALSNVALTDLEALANSGPRKLTLNNCDVDVASLRALEAIETLVLTDMPVESLRLPSGLKALHLGAHTGVEGLDGYSGGALEELHLSDLSIASLDGIERWPTLRAVTLSLLDGLTSLEPLSRLPALERAEVHSCPDVVDLRGLPTGPQIALDGLGITDLAGLGADEITTTLSLSSCAELTTLRGIAGLSRLTSVTIRSCPKLVDVSALAVLPRLRLLDLRDASGLTHIGALVGGPVKAVALHGTGVVADSVHPDLVWHCTWDEEVEMEEVAKRFPPPPEHFVLPKGEKKQVSALRKLFKSNNLESIKYALELVRALQNPMIYETLLAGAALRTKGIWSGSRVVSKKFPRAYGQYALMGIVASAPDDCAIAAHIRAEVVELDITGNDTQHSPFDFMHLEAFSALEILHIDRVGPILTGRSAPALPSLRKLYVRKLEALEDLQWITAAPKLEVLSFKNTPLKSIAGIEKAKGLRSIEFWSSPVEDLVPLLSLTKLERVYIQGHSGGEVAAELASRGVKLR